MHMQVKDKTAIEIISALGGIRPAAKKLDIGVSTVRGWKDRNNIPENRMEYVQKVLDTVLSGEMQGDFVPQDTTSKNSGNSQTAQNTQNSQNAGNSQTAQNTQNSQNANNTQTANNAKKNNFGTAETGQSKTHTSVKNSVQTAGQNTGQNHTMGQSNHTNMAINDKQKRSVMPVLNFVLILGALGAIATYEIWSPYIYKNKISLQNSSVNSAISDTKTKESIEKAVAETVNTSVLPVLEEMMTITEKTIKNIAQKNDVLSENMTTIENSVTTAINVATQTLEKEKAVQDIVSLLRAELTNMQQKYAYLSQISDMHTLQIRQVATLALSGEPYAVLLSGLQPKNAEQKQAIAILTKHKNGIATHLQLLDFIRKNHRVLSSKIAMQNATSYWQKIKAKLQEIIVVKDVNTLDKNGNAAKENVFEKLKTALQAKDYDLALQISNTIQITDLKDWQSDLKNRVEVEKALAVLLAEKK